LHQLVATQAVRTPDAIAVVFEPSAISHQRSAFSTHYATRNTQHVSYRELDTRANQLAHHLRALGVGLDTLVGLCMERSLEMIVGILGVLKAGGAYVPLDPTYPSERLAYMLDQAQAPVMLTQARLVGHLPTHTAHMACLDAQWPMIAHA